MAEFLSIQADLSEAMEAFKDLEERMPKIQRSMLAGIGSKAASFAKKRYSMELKKRSGNLYKNLKRVVTKRGDAVVIYSKAISENKISYGFVLAKGAIIEAKDGNLKFQINGKWITKKKVEIKPRDWLVKPVDQFIGSNDYHAQIDRLIQKEVDKLFKKGILKE